MGDIADYYRDQELDKQFKPISRPKPSFKTWKQSDNTSIKVVKMTKTHLENAIARIKSKKWRTQWLEPLEKELESRN